MDLSVVGHDGNGVCGSVTEGTTGASGASTDGNGWERWFGSVHRGSHWGILDNNRHVNIIRADDSIGTTAGLE